MSFLAYFTFTLFFLTNTKCSSINGLWCTVAIFLSGFHEAIGDTIALSVSTPSHLRMIENFLTGSAAEDKDEVYDSDEAKSTDELTTEEKENINFLMKTALAKVIKNPLKKELYRMKSFSTYTNVSSHSLELSC